MFSDADREIFRFQVHGQMRHADPLALRRALVRAAGGDLLGLAERAAEPRAEEPAPGPSVDDIPPEFRQAAGVAGSPSSPPPPPPPPPPEPPGVLLARLTAQEELLACVRAAFGLPAVDTGTGEGVTESECWRIWNSWNRWLAGEPSGAAS